MRSRVLVRPRRRLLRAGVGVLRRRPSASASGVRLRMLGRPFPAALDRQIGDRSAVVQFGPSRRFFELQGRRRPAPTAHARPRSASGRRQRRKLRTGGHGNQLTNGRRLPVALHGLASCLELHGISIIMFDYRIVLTYSQGLRVTTAIIIIIIIIEFL